MSWSLKLLSQYHKVAAAGCVSPQNPIKAFVLHSYLSSTSGESRMQIVLAERPSRHDLDLARINNFAVALTQLTTPPPDASIPAPTFADDEWRRASGAQGRCEHVDISRPASSSPPVDEPGF